MMFLMPCHMHTTFYIVLGKLHICVCTQGAGPYYACHCVIHKAMVHAVTCSPTITMLPQLLL